MLHPVKERMSFANLEFTGFFFGTTQPNFTTIRRTVLPFGDSAFGRSAEGIPGNSTCDVEISGNKWNFSLGMWKQVGFSFVSGWFITFFGVIRGAIVLAARGKCEE